MYTYDIGAQSMFDDRTAQFEKFGISLDDINNVRSRVTDMWADEPGGWVHEWSNLAERYADKGEHRMAALLYGCAKFPCLTDEARVRALRNNWSNLSWRPRTFR
jgi:esterase FrsA